jgi:hypothetical protein
MLSADEHVFAFFLDVVASSYTDGLLIKTLRIPARKSEEYGKQHITTKHRMQS